MASYRVVRAVDAVFYRFKKKGKRSDDLETAEKYLESLNVSAVQNFQVLENEGGDNEQSVIDEIFSIEDKETEVTKNEGYSQRPPATQGESLSLKYVNTPLDITNVEKGRTGEVGVGETEISGDMIQMEDFPVTATEIGAHSGGKTTTKEFEKNPLVKLSDSSHSKYFTEGGANNMVEDEVVPKNGSMKSLLAGGMILGKTLDDDVGKDGATKLLRSETPSSMDENGISKNEALFPEEGSSSMSKNAGSIISSEEKLRNISDKSMESGQVQSSRPSLEKTEGASYNDTSSTEIVSGTESSMAMKRTSSLTELSSDTVLKSEHTTEVSGKSGSIKRNKHTDDIASEMYEDGEKKTIIHTDNSLEKDEGAMKLKHTDSLTKIVGGTSLADEYMSEASGSLESITSEAHATAEQRSNDVLLKGVVIDETGKSVESGMKTKNIHERTGSIGDAVMKDESHVDESARNMKDTIFSIHSDVTSGNDRNRHRNDGTGDMNVGTDESQGAEVSRDKKRNVLPPLTGMGALVNLGNGGAGKMEGETLKQGGVDGDESYFMKGGNICEGNAKGESASIASSCKGYGSVDNKKSFSNPTMSGDDLAKDSSKNGKPDDANPSLSKMDETVLCDTEPTFLLNKVKFYPAFAIANLMAVAVQFLINGLSGSGPDGTLFQNKTGDLAGKYETDTTPASWTFGIWGFIYAWQAAWVVFSLVNICRKAPDGQPAHRDPPYIPNTVFLLQILVATLNIAWLITFDREEIEASLAMLIIYTISQYTLLMVSVRALDKCSPTLVRQGRTSDIWLTRALFHNGIGIQLAWVNVATLLNFQIVLIYSGDGAMCSNSAGTLTLSLLLVQVVASQIIDMVFLDVFTRYLLTPYIVVVVALTGSISKNWDSNQTNSIFSAVFLSYACASLSFKMGLTVYRHFTRPHFTTKCRYNAR